MNLLIYMMILFLTTLCVVIYFLLKGYEKLYKDQRRLERILEEHEKLLGNNHRT